MSDTTPRKVIIICERNINLSMIFRLTFDLNIFQFALFESGGLETQRDGSSLHGWYMLQWVSRVRPRVRDLYSFIFRCGFFSSRWKSTYILRRSLCFSQQKSAETKVAVIKSCFAVRDWWSESFTVEKRGCFYFSVKDNKANSP